MCIVSIQNIDIQHVGVSLKQLHNHIQSCLGKQWWISIILNYLVYQCGGAAGCFAFKCYSCQTNVNIYAAALQIHMLFAWQKWGSLKGFDWIRPIYINQHDRAQKTSHWKQYVPVAVEKKKIYAFNLFWRRAH